MDSGSLLLLVLAIGLVIFMFFSSRRRVQKQKLELEEKARQTVPGAEVLLQGGLYGTVVEYDGEDLDKPALVEIAPGVVIKVHSQAVLRVVDPAQGAVTEDELIEAEATEAGYTAGVIDGDVTSLSDDHRAARAAQAEADKDDKGRPAV